MSKIIIPPHTRCNFLDPDGILLMGACPIKDTLKPLLDYGIKLFINLHNDEKSDWYMKEVPSSGIEYIHLPIKSGSHPSSIKAKEVIDKILEVYKMNKKVYIHCYGGHGRAGTISALVLGKIHNLNAIDAIKMVEKCRENRHDKSRNFIPIPETKSQVKFLWKILGGNKEDLPDRSDKKWLTIIKKERKKKSK